MINRVLKRMTLSQTMLSPYDKFKLPSDFEQKLTYAMRQEPCAGNLDVTIRLLRDGYGYHPLSLVSWVDFFEEQCCFCNCEILMNYNFDKEDGIADEEKEEEEKTLLHSNLFYSNLI